MFSLTLPFLVSWISHKDDDDDDASFLYLCV